MREPNKSPLDAALAAVGELQCEMQQLCGYGATEREILQVAYPILAAPLTSELERFRVILNGLHDVINAERGSVVDLSRQVTQLSEELQRVRAANESVAVCDVHVYQITDPVCLVCRVVELEQSGLNALRVLRKLDKNGNLSPNDADDYFEFREAMKGVKETE